MSTSFKASAPGSMMVLGEYAVLHGKQALVCAVDKRIAVYLTPRSDATISINSALGELVTNLSQLAITPPFQFVMATLKKFRPRLKSGCDIVIESDFSATIGLGSSAAVTVALLAALNMWLKLKLSSKAMITAAREIIHHVQGLGSGADVAASVLGGMVAYKMQGSAVRRLKHCAPLIAVYCGHKTPTVEAVNTVKKTFASQPKIFRQLCAAIDACSSQGIKAANQADWQQLGKIMTIQQGLMVALGVSDMLLDELINQLRHSPGIHGAKISGSGLGDCVLGLGSTRNLVFTQAQVKIIPVVIATQGVGCEKI